MSDVARILEADPPAQHTFSIRDLEVAGDYAPDRYHRDLFRWAARELKILHQVLDTRPFPEKVAP